jgi:hypothetical protein
VSFCGNQFIAVGDQGNMIASRIDNIGVINTVFDKTINKKIGIVIKKHQIAVKMPDMIIDRQVKAAIFRFPEKLFTHPSSNQKTES